MKNKKNFFDYISQIFLLISVLVIVFIVVTAATFNQPDRIMKWNENFEGEWTRIYADGQREKVNEPVAYCDIDELLTFESVLPSQITGDTIFAIYTYRNAAIYIDGIKRAAFTNDDNPLPGKNVKHFFLEVKLTGEDAGKTIRVEKYSSRKQDGIFQVYYGDTYGIFHQVFAKYGAQFILAAVLFFISLVLGIASLFLIGKMDEWRLIQSLSLGYIGLTFWLMVDSLLFQFVFGIYYVDGVWGYLVTMLFIFPFIYFINILQERRYEIVANTVSIILIIDFVVVTTLHFTDVMDFNITRPYMNGVIALGIVFVILTAIIDVIKGNAKDYRPVIIGLIGMAITGVLEVVRINTGIGGMDGVMLLAGLYFLLVTSMIQIFSRIKENQDKVEDAIRANKLKSEFLANMSHEIRTPINAIMGMNEMILRDTADEEIIQYATNIKHASNNLLTIINDILDFSKIESGRIELIQGDYSLLGVFEDVVTMMKIKADEKKLELRYSINEDIPDGLYGDGGKLRQIMINILNNAIKYTKQGFIDFTVDGRVAEDYILIKVVVKDTGIGIKKEDIDKLFQKFSRVDEKKNRNIEGTGLGLAITKKFVEMMSGDISVDSEYTKGSTFTVTVMQKIRAYATISEIKAQKPLQENKENREDKPKIKKDLPENAGVLVVDDVEMNLMVMQGLLQHIGLKVDVASSGKECLEMIKEKKYNIIFMDHMMPEMDGIETLENMKKCGDHENTDTPVIVLTANAIVGAEDHYYKAGFVDYLSKPIDVDKLEDMVVKYI